MVKLFEELTSVKVESVEEGSRTVEDEDDDEDDDAMNIEELELDDIDRARRKSIRRNSIPAARFKKHSKLEDVINHKCVQSGHRGGRFSS
jgi:hypothetical protein